MAVTLPLSEMTTSEKLQAMEALWSDLCRDESQLSSPSWHGDILAEREQLIASGKARFSSWDEAKKRLEARVHENPNPGSS